MEGKRSAYGCADGFLMRSRPARLCFQPCVLIDCIGLLREETRQGVRWLSGVDKRLVDEELENLEGASLSRQMTDQGVGNWFSCRLRSLGSPFCPPAAVSSTVHLARESFTSTAARRTATPPARSRGEQATPEEVISFIVPQLNLSFSLESVAGVGT